MDDLDGIKLELVADHLRCGQTVNVIADGHSMNPFIHKGDILTLRGRASDPLRPGEIVAFIRNNFLFIHRILEVGRKDGMVLTKGDNLQLSDSLAGAGEIIGFVVAIHDRSLTTKRLTHRIFFTLYQWCLTAGNHQNIVENQEINQISIGDHRFRISMVILRIYRFFIFL